MQHIFTFDVKLKDLMNLGERAKKFGKLGLVFEVLKAMWYTLDDKEAEKERWNRIRVGSVKVFLDDSNVFHMDFFTRFNFDKVPNLKQAFDKFQELQEKDEDYFKLDYKEKNE